MKKKMNTNKAFGVVPELYKVALVYAIKRVRAQVLFHKMMAEVLHKYNLKQGKWRARFLVRDARKRWRTK